MLLNASSVPQSGHIGLPSILRWLGVRYTPARIRGRCVIWVRKLSFSHPLYAYLKGGIEVLFIEAEVIVTFHAAPDVAVTRYAKLSLLVHDVGEALFLFDFAVF